MRVCPGTGPGEDGQTRLDGFAVDAEALVLARRLGLVVAEVTARAQQRPGSAVRMLVAGRRVRTQGRAIW